MSDRTRRPDTITLFAITVFCAGATLGMSVATIVFALNR